MTDKRNLEQLNKIAPLVLLSDILIAGGIWFFREHIFTADMHWVAAPVAIIMMLGALIGYFILQSLADKAARK